YMSNAEQNFVMDELARMKGEGRIEVLRERGANFHVFAFINGQRPRDDLITASLDEIGPPAEQTSDAEQSQSQHTSLKVKTKPRAAKSIRSNSKTTRTTSKVKPKRRR